MSGSSFADAQNRRRTNEDKRDVLVAIETMATSVEAQDKAIKGIATAVKDGLADATTIAGGAESKAAKALATCVSVEGRIRKFEDYQRQTDTIWKRLQWFFRGQVV